MPRNAFGIYAPPPGTAPILPNTLADATKMEARLFDVGGEITASLPRNGTAPMLANLPMGGKRIMGLGVATDPGDAPPLSQVTTLVGDSAATVATPPGVVVDFAGPVPPNGWLLCDGLAVPRTTYAALFAVIGTTFGAGDGATTFNVPDYRGRVSAGKDDMGGVDAGHLSSFVGAPARTLGGAFGAASHTLTEMQMPDHKHDGATASAGAHNHMIGVSFSGAGVGSDGGYVMHDGVGGTATPTTNSGAHIHNFSTDQRGGGQAHNNVQPTIVLNKIIKH